MTRLLTIIALLFATPAWAEEVLYCVSEVGTGIIKKNGSWQAGRFKEKKFTVKYDSDKNQLSGLNGSPWPCTIKNNNLSCIQTDAQNYGKKFHMHLGNKRFAYFSTSVFSYVYNGPATDTIYYGTCQNF